MANVVILGAVLCIGFTIAAVLAYLADRIEGK
jgi:hypothetical protein